MSQPSSERPNAGRRAQLDAPAGRCDTMPRRAKPVMKIAIAVLLLLAWVCGLLFALPAGS